MAQASNTDDPRVTPMDGTDGGFWVRSRTRRGLAHTVHVPEATCTCEAGQHGVECWHLDFCRAVYYWHRYDQRAQLWRERARRVEEARAKMPQTKAGDAIAAFQALYPTVDR